MTGVFQKRWWTMRKRGTMLVLAILCWSPQMAIGEPALWQAMEAGGHAILLRHALAPGTGDPTDFELRDCATQRNLSDVGRDQARRIGARLRASKLTLAGVFSSQWCRCLETARLLGLGPVTELPALNSFFRQSQYRERQTRDLRDWLAAHALRHPPVLVTHQVNITALTGVYPSSGEMVIVKIDDEGAVTVAGTVATE